MSGPEVVENLLPLWRISRHNSEGMIRTLPFFAVLLGVTTGCAQNAKTLARDELLARCAAPIEAVRGQLWIQAKTQEIQGQFPATVSIEKSGDFVLEITNLLGGTQARLVGRGGKLNLVVVAKPALSRPEIAEYLGLNAEQWARSLSTGLWCGSFEASSNIEVKVLSHDDQGRPLRVRIRHQDDEIKLNWRSR